MRLGQRRARLQRLHILNYLWAGLRAQPGRLTYAVGCLLLSVLFACRALAVAIRYRRGSCAAGGIQSGGIQSGGGRPGGLVPWSPESLVLACSLALVGLVTMRAIADYYQTVIFSIVGNQVVSDLRNRVFGHLQTLSLAFHQKSRGGDLTIRLISDMNMLKEVTVSAALPLLCSGLLLVGMFAYMMYLNWRLGLHVAAVLPLFWFLAYRKSRKIHQAASVQRQREGALAATAAESIAAVKSVQAQRGPGSLSRGVLVAKQKESAGRREDQPPDRGTRALGRHHDRHRFGHGALAGNALCDGGRLHRRRADRVPHVFEAGLQTAAGFCQVHGQDFQGPGRRESHHGPAGARTEHAGRYRRRRGAALRGSIEFQNVAFAYASGQPVLRKLSFQLQAGQSLAIVGPSGVGKSTLLSLLMRSTLPRRERFESTAGIRDDGRCSRCDRNSASCCKRPRFSRTPCGRTSRSSAPEATMEQVEAAAKIAQAHEFITSLPEGYETILGERGADLSQGQRQRLAIARAALSNTPILILDEPTSNLDGENQQKVIAALRRVAGTDHRRCHPRPATGVRNGSCTSGERRWRS